MSRLTELISQTKSKDPQLGTDLEREFKALSSRREFGLNFERHRPEIVELPNRLVRKSDKVRILPERGSTKKGDQQLWIVKKIKKNKKESIATIESTTKEEKETKESNVDDLIVIAEFQDYIYPGLVSAGKVENGDEKPYHTVINGENYHALKALTFTHKGKIDAIYIDPPYNTGAKDWKYNNNYVESEDVYRHSKWLAFIERRIKLAKALLNPSNSVLIVTIDEKEYLRLGMLLEQIFPETRIQMISSTIKPSGAARGKEFYRVDEYIFVVFIGAAEVADILVPGLCISNSSSDNEEDSDEIKEAKKVRWGHMLRSGSEASREDRPLMFYPILVSFDTNKIVNVGEPLPKGKHPADYSPPKGLVPIWPIRQDGSEGRWMLGADAFMDFLPKKYIKISSINKKNKKVVILYLPRGLREKLEDGRVIISGKDKFDGINLKYSDTESVSGRPKTQWNSKSHSATDHGSSLLLKIIPGRKFPFPKSLYAVEDVLRFFISDKPNSTVLDFFAGSGSTAHSVMRLNKQDGGNRLSISITNNEVSADEQKELIKKGLRPGDGDWEKWGICDYITKPRIKAAITGKTPDGKSIKGDYKFTDEFPMSDGFKENAEFFTLTYETPMAVSYNLAFEHIAPLLWMRAGSKGKRIDSIPESGWAVADNYGVLFDLDKSSEFYNAIGTQSDIRIAYIVTDDDRRFQSIAKRLPKGVEPVRLYESYLKNFQFTNDI